jgi:hypothetical protein
MFPSGGRKSFAGAVEIGVNKEAGLILIHTKQRCYDQSTRSVDRKILVNNHSNCSTHFIN